MELKGRECLKIRQLAGIFDYSAESKMAGEKYLRYAHLDKVFIVNQKDRFNQDFEDGKVYTINLTQDEEGLLSFAGHTTVGQEITMKKTEVMLESITIENVKVDLATFEQLA